MSFASPLMFWGLLSLIPLVALYFLKIRPARKPVTAWFLWEKVFVERKARTLFQKFRDVLSLLLLAALFVAAVTAAARPAWRGDTRRDLVLVLDNSASMNAADGGPTRLERARATAGSIVRSLNGSQRCCIASLADRVVFHSGLTDNPRELLDAINRIQPTVLPSTRHAVGQLPSIAPYPTANTAAKSPSTLATPPATLSPSVPSTSSVVSPPAQVSTTPPTPSPSASSVPSAVSPSPTGPASSSRPPRVILISDGILGADIPPDIELLKTGSPGRGNAGLVACDMQRLPQEGAPAGVFFQVASTFPEPLQADLEICHGAPGRPLRVIPVEIKPGLNPPETVRLDEAPEGKWFLQLRVSDSLPDDNVVHAVLPPVVPVDVAVLADGGFFYETSVQAFSQGNQLLRLVSPAAASVLVCQGNVDVSSTKPDAGLLVFQPSGESEWWNSAGDGINVALPVVNDEEHPLLRYLDGHSLPWVGARKLKAPPGAEVLIAGDDGTPLLYRLVSRGRSAVVVNLDPVAANFFLSPLFPVMVHTAATHLGGRPVAEPGVVPTGTRLTLPVADGAGATKWDQPGGAALEIESGSTGPLEQPGFHRFTTRGREWMTGCSLLAPGETLLDNTAVADTSQPVARGWLPASLLTALAIGLLVLESVLFHRRLAG